VAGLRVAIAITSSRSEGGKAPGSTRARGILQATEALFQVATSPPANGVTVTMEIRGHLKIRRAVWRRRPEDHLTPKGQGLGGRSCTYNPDSPGFSGKISTS
jgi:hypothetical protein